MKVLANIGIIHRACELYEGINSTQTVSSKKVLFKIGIITQTVRFYEGSVYIGII